MIEVNDAYVRSKSSFVSVVAVGPMSVLRQSRSFEVEERTNIVRQSLV